MRHPAAQGQFLLCSVLFLPASTLVIWMTLTSSLDREILRMFCICLQAQPTFTSFDSHASSKQLVLAFGSSGSSRRSVAVAERSGTVRQ